jgi:hypothetical protein
LRREMKTGTLVSVCGAALLVAGAAFSEIAVPIRQKDAAGCSLSAGRPRRGSCDGVGESQCYECYYSNDSGEWTCYESIDGSIQYCKRTSGGGGPLVY